MGSRKYGVLSVFHLPGSADVIGCRILCLSAHSDTVRSSGGVHAIRSESVSSTIRAGNLKGSEMGIDPLGQ